MIRRPRPVPLVQPYSAPRKGRAAPSERAGTPAAEALREVCDPVTSILISAEAVKRWLSRDEPNLAEARDAIELLIGSSQRVADALADFSDLVCPPAAAPTCRDLARQTSLLPVTAAWRREERRRRPKTSRHVRVAM